MGIPRKPRPGKAKRPTIAYAAIKGSQSDSMTLPGLRLPRLIVTIKTGSRDCRDEWDRICASWQLTAMLEQESAEHCPPNKYGNTFPIWSAYVVTCHSEKMGELLEKLALHDFHCVRDYSFSMSARVPWQAIGSGIKQQKRRFDGIFRYAEKHNVTTQHVKNALGIQSLTGSQAIRLNPPLADVFHDTEKRNQAKRDIRRERVVSKALWQYYLGN